MDVADASYLADAKENIQPLRQGRNTSQLSLALQAETSVATQQELQKQREYFEVQVRAYKGDDPLSVWCEYILWVEQSFPKQGHKSQLDNLLKKCINKFKDVEKYSNDARFVRLCIKYAEIRDNTLEVMQQIYGHNIGSESAEFYTAWAEMYAIDTKFKKASLIYQKGIEAKVKPLKLIEDAYLHFQLYIGRRCLENFKEPYQPPDRIYNENNENEIRVPYNSLRTLSLSNREVVPSIRIGNNVLGPAGKLPMKDSNSRKIKTRPVTVFEDAGDSEEFSGTKKIEKLHSKKSASKENLIKSSGKVNKATPGTFTLPSVGTPFTVHTEETEELQSTPHTVPSSVLKERKHQKCYEDPGFDNMPLFLEEPYDPKRVAKYCKDQVYAGGIEFQFEELRAICYRKKREEELKKEAEVKTARVENMKPKKERERSKPYSRKSIAAEVEVNPHKKSTVTRKTIGGLANKKYMEDNTLDQTSFTIHTKEAMNEIHNLWFSERSVQETRESPKASKFDVFVNGSGVDENILAGKSDVPEIPVYVDESCVEPPCKPPSTNAKKFEFFVDDSCLDGKSLGARRKSRVFTVPEVDDPVDFSRGNDGIPYVKPPDVDEELGPDDKENNIPPTTNYPTSKSTRPVTGVLTTAENVPFSPLEVEDESDMVEGIDPIDRNTTCPTETWNYTKNFKSPKFYSTPNYRKSNTDCDGSVQDAKEKLDKDDRSSKNVNRCLDLSKPSTSQEHENQLIQNCQTEQVVKNLSTIVETSREYKSSSSSSSTFCRRSMFGASKSQHFTPLLSKQSVEYTKSTTKVDFTLSAGQTNTRVRHISQNLTGYDASSEFSHGLCKTPKLPVCVDVEEEELNIKLKSSLKITNKTEEKFVELINKENSPVAMDEVQDEVVLDCKDIDPFDCNLIERLLTRMKFPKGKHEKGFHHLDQTIAIPSVGGNLVLGKTTYNIKMKLGEGAYAKVFKLVNTANSNSKIAKFQKPSWPWEFYISREIQLRLKDKSMVPAFAYFEEAYIFDNCSVLTSPPVDYGDLLSVMNFFKQKEGKTLLHGIVVSFTVEILNILEYLHSCKIIHADIKPDNFLVLSVTSQPHLQLIDFGRSIDMSLFPENTSFKKVVTTESFTCIEMLTGRDWTYQTDLFGAANCAHCMMFGEYMKPIENNGTWNITKNIPRYWPKEEWKQFFNQLLNIESCSQLPDLKALREEFQGYLASVNVEAQFTRLGNVLKKR